MKYLASVLLLLGYALSTSAGEPPRQIGEPFAGETYLPPGAAAEPSEPAGEPMPHQMNPGLVEDAVLFMAADVSPHQGPVANALEPAGESLAKNRKLMVVLIRKNSGATREKGEKLLRDMRRAGDDLAKYGKWLGWIDTFGNVVFVGSSIYHGDSTGAVQDSANALLSGASASTGQMVGVVTGGVIGHVIAGPPGGLLLGTAGGVIGSGFASFLHDATLAKAINSTADRAALGTYDRASQQNALRRAGALLAQIPDSIRRGKWADAEAAARQARAALVVAGCGACDADVIDKIVEYGNTLRELEGDIAYAREKSPEAFDRDLELAMTAALVARERIGQRDYDNALSVIQKGLELRDRLTSGRGREVVEEMEHLDRLTTARRLLDVYETMVSDAEKFLQRSNRGEANRLAGQVDAELAASGLLSFPDGPTRSGAEKALARARSVLRATVPAVDKPPAPEPQPRRRDLFVGRWTPAGTSPLGNIVIEVYKKSNGYEMMPEHGLRKGLHVQGIYAQVSGTAEMRMTKTSESTATYHIRTRIDNQVTHDIQNDRLVFHTRVVDERLSGGRVISQEVVNDFTVPLKRRD